MKLDGKQAMLVWDQIMIHRDVNNTEAVALHKLLWESPSAQTKMNELLAEGHPYLCQIVSELVEERL
jgi:hypothetical protein